MKICILTHSFPPVIGGAQTWQYFLATYLVRFGHKVQVITGDLPKDYKEQDFSKEGFSLVRINGLRQASKLEIPYKDILPVVYKTIEEFNPQVVHSHGYSLCLLFSLMQSRLNTKHVFSYHATPIPEDQKLAGIFKEYALEQSLTEFVFKHCPFDAYIANSQYYFDSSISRGMPKEKAKLIYYGIDLQKFNPNVIGNREKWGYETRDYVISCPIRLIERKGIFDILQAVKFLNCQRIKLFIPTSRLSTPSGLESKVNEAIEKYGIQKQVNIVFDKVSVFEMPEIYAMSDLTVLPSHVEGLGIVLLESLATKTPVVATIAPGINEVIKDGKTGILAKTRNPEDLANKIKLAMENPKQSQLLAANGYEFVKNNFDIQKQTKKVEKIYQDIFD